MYVIKRAKCIDIIRGISGIDGTIVEHSSGGLVPEMGPRYATGMVEKRLN
jgi:hypothetical protein